MPDNEYSPGEEFYLELAEELKVIESLSKKLALLDQQRKSHPQYLEEIEHAAWEMYLDQARKVPSNLDDFKILSRLDEGGMGTIYLAEQEPFQRKVVIKTISPLKFCLESPQDFEERIATARRLFQARAKNPGLVTLNQHHSDFFGWRSRRR